MELKGISQLKNFLRELDNYSGSIHKENKRQDSLKFNLVRENIREQTLSEAKEERKDSKLFLEKLQKVLFSLNKGLKIELDEELKIPIYKIIDLQTKEVLTQIPLEDLLKFKKALAKFLQEISTDKDKINGLLLEKEV